MKRVYLEITDACNLNCPFCTYEKGHSFMEYKEIEDYISQIRPFCRYIYLHILGEPLLHPDFDKILNLLDEKDMQLQLVSNGTLLSHHKDLCKHRSLRKISISLHSFTDQKTSEEYFQGIDELLKDHGNAYLELRFFNSSDLPSPVKAYYDYLVQSHNLQKSDRKNSYNLGNNVYLRTDEFFRWPSLKDEFISDNGTCYGAQDMIAITVNGEVTICCLDPLAINSIGNLHDHSLKEILASERYQQYLKEFKERKLTSELCKRCSYRLRFK